MRHPWRNIIMAGVASPVLVAFMFGIWGASVRTRDNESQITHTGETLVEYQTRVFRRFDDVEDRLGDVEDMQEDLAAFEAQRNSDDKLLAMIVDENRDEHREIKAQMATNRNEVMEALHEVKVELISEFRNGNGH